MTLVLPQRSIRAHGLYQARGLDSALDQQGRSGVVLGGAKPSGGAERNAGPAPLGVVGQPLAWGPHCFLPAR